MRTIHFPFLSVSIEVVENGLLVKTDKGATFVYQTDDDLTIHELIEALLLAIVPASDEKAPTEKVAPPLVPLDAAPGDP